MLSNCTQTVRKSSQQLAEMYCSYRPEGGAVVCAACSIQRSSVQMLEDKGKVHQQLRFIYQNPNTLIIPKEMMWVTVGPRIH